MTKKLEVHLTQIGVGKVIVNDKDISDMVYKIEITSEARELTEVIIFLRPKEVTLVDNFASVEIEETTDVR